MDRVLNRRDFLKTIGRGAAALTLPAWATSCARHQSGTRHAARPNVLLIMADDMGFSDARCYGGDIQTPNLDALAAGGLRFTQHYSAGRCWPSRACILTGYYAQHIRRDKMEGIRLGDRPAWAPLVPELLKPLGYRSYHSGKWHIDGKPTECGFDRSWGRHKFGCDWDRYFSSKIWSEDGTKAPVELGQQYYSTVAIADHAVQCLKLHEQEHGNEPFFQYVAFYSPHFPLHAMKKDIDRYRDAYLAGWDVIRQKRWERMKRMGIINCALSDRDGDIVPGWNLEPAQLKERIGPGEAPYAVAWDSLTQQQKQLQATKMAIHAAMIHRMDAEIGRIIKKLKEMGAYHNTLILFASDNGASAEQIIRGDKHDKSAPPGSAKSYLCLGPGWSTAANTPLRLHKHWTHEGGISSPFIVHWPAGISAEGELRHDPSHFIDFVPTVLDLVGAAWLKEYNGQKVPEHPGKSLVPAFAKNGSVKRKNLWWCHRGNRAIRAGDWKLTMRSHNEDTWELYNLKNDRCEMNDLASKFPDKVRMLAEQWKAIADGLRKDLM
ncbi:MAG: sulfatase-like hydrolase/transferase [Planctomycetota bacterium]